MANIAKTYDKQDVLKKKQWTKYLSKATSLTLMHFNKESKLYKSYQNTSFCAEVLATNSEGQLTTSYCKNRWCQTCNRIRTALLINGYFPELEQLEQPCFVTLTLPTVEGKDLPKRIKEMQKQWTNIYNVTRYAKFKRTYPHFKGVRKAEVTIRPNDKYHYHYHFIVDGLDQANWLKNQWLKRNPEANPKAQDVRESDLNGLRELFKYAIKSEVKLNEKVSAVRYDLVFRALRGKRTYQTFGGIKMIKEDFDEEDLENKVILEDRPNRIFKWVSDDWWDKLTGEPLVNLEIPKKVKEMIGVAKYEN